MKKIILSVVLLILLTGCNRSLLKQTETLSDNILNIIYEENYDISSLSKKNQELLNNLIEKEKIENKTINISELFDFIEETKDISKGTTQEVFFNNGDYYIKYTDMQKLINENKSSVTVIYVDGYAIPINEQVYPILRIDTIGNTDYKFRYIKRKKEKNVIRYYYKSFGNGKKFIIKYKLNNNKIEDIDLIFNKYYVD